jgi:hypothetical protein
MAPVVEDFDVVKQTDFGLFMYSIFFPVHLLLLSSEAHSPDNKTQS